MVSPSLPRGFLWEAMSTKHFGELVADLGVPHRARAALWRLVAAGPAALPVLREGLFHADPSVRAGCCEAVDQGGMAAAVPELFGLLADSDARVRFMAAHALECKRCERRAVRGWSGRGVN